MQRYKNVASDIQLFAIKKNKKNKKRKEKIMSLLNR